MSSSKGLLAAKGHFGPLLPRLLRARGSFCANGRQLKRTLVATGDLAAREAIGGKNGVWQASTEGRREYSQLRSSRDLALSKPVLLQRYQVGTLFLLLVDSMRKFEFSDISGNMVGGEDWVGYPLFFHAFSRLNLLSYVDTQIKS